MATPIKIKRGTRAQLDTAATNGQLLEGEPYLITDEGRLAVGLGPDSYQAFAKDVAIVDGGTASTSQFSDTLNGGSA